MPATVQFQLRSGSTFVISKGTQMPIGVWIRPRAPGATEVAPAETARTVGPQLGHQRNSASRGQTVFTGAAISMDARAGFTAL